jgi:hypothetical protein
MMRLVAPDLERLARKYVWWEEPERALGRRSLLDEPPRTLDPAEVRNLNVL